MENQTFKILWIDDMHEEMTPFKREASDFDIELISFKSLDGGLTELEKNYNKYDGVILDGKIFEYENDADKTEDFDNSIEAKQRIDKLPKKFEIHVFTGQYENFSRTHERIFKEEI